MKKKYIKPQVNIENFEVKEFVAGACAGKTIIKINLTLDNCAYQSPSGAILLSAYCATLKGGVNIYGPSNPNGSDHAMVCYHSATDFYFNS